MRDPSTLIWPRILKSLAEDGPADSYELAERLNETPRRVYASMSGLGRAGNRWWIRPVGRHWRRRAPFELTNRGLDRLLALA